jgi:hypothetical protein
MATDFVSTSLMMYVDGILKHNGASQALHQNVMATSCKAKFFTVKETCSSTSFVHTTPRGLLNLMMMHETDIPFCV